MAKIKTSKGDFYYSPKILYLGIKQIDKVQSLENLRILSMILDSKKMNWGVAFGSLLGIVRDHDFITWDEDIDMYILEEEEESFKECLWLLKEKGFELVRYERRGLYSVMRKGEYMDFYVLKKLSSNLRTTNGGGYIFEKYLQNTEEIEFKGIKLRIPKEYDEYLTFQYGDWRTPVQYANFEMNSLQRFFSKLSFYIKNSLPDCLYYPLLERHHKKDFLKFEKKCNDKGIKLDL